MTLGLLFWILMILWFIFGIGMNTNWSAGWQGFSGNLLLFILLFLLGWAAFGFVIQGGGGGAH